MALIRRARLQQEVERRNRVAQKAAELVQLQDGQRDWRDALVVHSISTGLTALLASGVLEVVLNYGALDKLLRPAAYTTAIEWNLTLGLEDADATVIVTALLVLVATFNVALAATDIGAPRTALDSARAASWKGAVVVISRIAGVVSVIGAVSRFPESPGLGLVLSALAVLSIVSSGTMLNRPDARTPLLLRRSQLLNRSSALEKQRRRLVERFFVDHRDPRLKEKLRNQIVAALWIVLGSIAATILTVLPGYIRVSDLLLSLNEPAPSFVNAQTFLPLSVLGLVAFTSFATMTILELRFWAGRRARSYRLAVGLHLLLVAGWLGIFIWASRGMTDFVWWLELEILPYALAPIAVPIMLVGSAALFHRGPGLRIVALVHESVESDRRMVCGELTDIRHKLWMPTSSSLIES